MLVHDSLMFFLKNMSWCQINIRLSQSLGRRPCMLIFYKNVLRQLTKRKKKMLGMASCCFLLENQLPLMLRLFAFLYARETRALWNDSLETRL